MDHQPQSPGSVLPQAQALDEMLRHASPAEVIEAALKIVGRERLAPVSYTHLTLPTNREV